MSDPLLEDDEVPGWIFTFADLMSLLLVFFILLFSLSKLTDTVLESALSSIQIAMNSKGSSKEQDKTKRTDGGSVEIKPIDPKTVVEGQLESAAITAAQKEIQEKIANEKEIKKAAESIAKQITQSQLSRAVKVNSDGESITITVDGKTLFESGDAELSFESDYIFQELLKIFLFYFEFSINIKGHTDDIPIRTPKFDSNWELSAIRATTVLRSFLEEGVEATRMTATGYADSVPLVENNSEANRALNRRVEFVLKKN